LRTCSVRFGCLTRLLIKPTVTRKLSVSLCVFVRHFSCTIHFNAFPTSYERVGFVSFGLHLCLVRRLVQPSGWQPYVGQGTAWACGVMSAHSGGPEYRPWLWGLHMKDSYWFMSPTTLRDILNDSGGCRCVQTMAYTAWSTPLLRCA
jgi:hypothetical protein